jgi:hypothetical protein
MKSVHLLVNLQILFHYIALVVDPILRTQFENMTDDDILDYRFLIFVSKCFGPSRRCNLPSRLRALEVTETSSACSEPTLHRNKYIFDCMF